MAKSSKKTRRGKATTADAASPKGSVGKRLAALEAAVASLVAAKSDADAGGGGSGEPPGRPEKFWVIKQIEEHLPEQGGVVFGGHVTLPSEETYAWQIESVLDDLLAADWSVTHLPLAALAHPMRLAILKALMEGKRDTQSLQTLPDMGTTGQLYHHLKELESAGWIRQPRRGQYNLLAERVVPLLTILATCEVTDKK